MWAAPWRQGESSGYCSRSSGHHCPWQHITGRLLGLRWLLGLTFMGAQMQQVPSWFSQGQVWQQEQARRQPPQADDDNPAQTNPANTRNTANHNATTRPRHPATPSHRPPSPASPQQPPQHGQSTRPTANRQRQPRRPKPRAPKAASNLEPKKAAVPRRRRRNLQRIHRAVCSRGAR